MQARAGGWLGVVVCALVLQPAHAQTVAEFYASNPLTIIVASDPGGGYDV